MQWLTAIVNWCNNNQGFMMVVLTTIYVVATIFIYTANNKSVKGTEQTLKQNSEIQKQNVDIQLFNDRFNLYNSCKENIEKRYYSITQPDEMICGSTEEEKYNEDIEIKILKVKYLFTEECYEQLLEVLKIVNHISCLCADINYIYELIRAATTVDNEFINEINSFVLSYVNGVITDSHEEDFKKLCDNSELNAEIITDEHKWYNYYKMYKEIVELEHKFETEKGILFRQFKKELGIGGKVYE